MKTLAHLFLLLLPFLSGTADAAQVYWVDWTSLTPASTTTGRDTVEGELLLPGGGGVSVTYVGRLNSSAPHSGAILGDSAPDVWSPDGPYLSGDVPTAPPATDWIVPRYTDINDWHHLSLSSPVQGLLLALSGLNGYQVYFDHPFSILSSSDPTNPGQYGTGSLSRAGNTLGGGSGAHGIIRFSGTVQDLYWRASSFAKAQGVTFGVSAVPLPPALWLLLAPLAILKLPRRFKD